MLRRVNTGTPCARLRRIVFLWLGPGGSLVFLDSFAPQLERHFVGWQVLLLLACLLLLHNAIWLMMLFPSCRECVARRRVTQYILLALSVAAWIALAVVLQKYFSALRELARSGIW